MTTGNRDNNIRLAQMAHIEEQIEALSEAIETEAKEKRYRNAAALRKQAQQLMEQQS